ncbi:hypothetical protein EDD80_10528 [Anseongella ginsenosidimutans]|uniref:Uncharacterized protein n=1 Tax=Anseongella ginsenosidimutans TaxID=496056 RepID=A0A4V2UTQ4_9SPHI|nr:hypothetical protein [Anseongella ginsenosidimutans]QEC52833.1 hypothetical protein FRZ59_11135 [Anseongella ginsenosidimutans]TCS87216.1 hypothetical protein EDD80_10528 [Anseongella ginsenosidimutans]
MNRLLFIFGYFLISLFSGSISVSAGDIPDFAVREQEGETIKLVALDASGNSLQDLSGVFPFSVNGFETDIRFKDGQASFPQEVAAATFLYLKHEGGTGSTAHLYYVYRGLSGGFSVIHIPLALLVVVPLALILLGMFFRRLIILMLLLLGAFFYFNSSKGLSLDSFLDAAREWIGGLLQVILGIS